MPPKNRYYRCSKLSEAWFLEVLEYFCERYTASDATWRCGLSLRSTTPIFQLLRAKMAAWSETDLRPFTGRVQIGDCLFGPLTRGGSPGRRPPNKIIVLGFFDSDGRVYTCQIPDLTKVTLHRAIQPRVPYGASIVTNKWRGYIGLGNLEYTHEMKGNRVWRIENPSTSQKENLMNFWYFVRRGLVSKRGLPTRAVFSHVKEHEYRWNHRSEPLFAHMAARLLEDPL